MHGAGQHENQLWDTLTWPLHGHGGHDELVQESSNPVVPAGGDGHGLHGLFNFVYHDVLIILFLVRVVHGHVVGVGAEGWVRGGVRDRVVDSGGGVGRLNQWVGVRGHGEGVVEGHCGRWELEVSVEVRWENGGVNLWSLFRASS